MLLKDCKVSFKYTEMYNSTSLQIMLLIVQGMADIGKVNPVQRNLRLHYNAVQPIN